MIAGRPLFLRRSHAPKADPRSTKQPRQKVKGSILWAILGDLLVWSGLVRRELSPEELYAQTVREAADRRAKLRAQLAAKHKNDSRRGGVERELRRHTLVVLSGGRP